MNTCDYDNTITLIEETECLFDSLNTINTNFKNISDVICDLKNRVDAIKMIRTFFYYGANAQTSAQSDMDTNEISRPSNTRIENFINLPEQLNLPNISELNDIAYVIYQKTGYLNNRGTGPNITTNFRTTGLQIDQTNNNFAPIFFIWQLNCVKEDNKLIYRVSNGWPKIHRTETSNSVNFNQPQNWVTYNSWL